MTTGVKTVSECGAALVAALVAIRQFAAEHGLGHWVTWFTDALARPSVIRYHPDMLLGRYPDAARSLAARAAASWVFGGMGSWNDVHVPGPDEEDMRRLSNALYDAVRDAVVTVVNNAD